MGFSITELITKLYEATETPEASEKNILKTTFTEQLVNALKTQELMWAAFCPSTKHYFLAQEKKQMTAYLFSEEAYCDTFAKELRKKHIILRKIENKQAHRMFLFAELYRCGVTQVVINSEQEYAAVPLQLLVPVPDYSALPLVQRPVLNPAVTGKILCLMQDVSFGKANGNMELDVLQEIYHSAFLQPFHPAEDGKPEEPGIYCLPDGQQLFMVFTDLYSLKQMNPEAYEKARVVRYADMLGMLSGNTDITSIIINPGSGSPMLLDVQLLEVAEKAASGTLDNVVIRNLDEQAGRIVVTKPERTPQAMINQMKTVLEESQMVKAAYLRSIRHEEEIRPNHLIILDWDAAATKQEKAEIQKKISEAAFAYARGLDMEYVSYETAVGKEWTGSAEPFFELHQSESEAERKTAEEITEQKSPVEEETKKQKSRNPFRFFKK